MEKKNYSTVVRRLVSKTERILLILLFIFGIYLITKSSGSFYGKLILFTIPFFLTAYDGIDIDFNRKKYRATMSVFFLKFGKWIDLPFIEKIEVYPATEIWGGKARNSLYASRKVYEIRVLPKRGRNDFIIGRFSSASEADLNVKELSKNLNVEYKFILRKGDVLDSGLVEKLDHKNE